MDVRWALHVSTLDAFSPDSTVPRFLCPPTSSSGRSGSFGLAGSGELVLSLEHFNAFLDLVALYLSTESNVQKKLVSWAGAGVRPQVLCERASERASEMRT